MNESPTLSRRLETWASGPLQATVDFEVLKTTDPLEFLFTVRNDNQGAIRFPCGAGAVSISFSNAANLPIPTPDTDPPMDLEKGAKDPNDELIEFYAINKNGKPGKRFREKTFPLAPKESIQILVRMGPEMMKQLNGFLRMRNKGESQVKLGVWTLFSIVPLEDRDFFARFQLNPKIFFQYQIPKQKKE